MAERSVNKAILLGRLGSDAETRFTQNGTPVSRVSLAMNRQWTDSDKQRKELQDGEDLSPRAIGDLDVVILRQLCRQISGAKTHGAFVLTNAAALRFG